MHDYRNPANVHKQGDKPSSASRLCMLPLPRTHSLPRVIDLFAFYHDHQQFCPLSGKNPPGQQWRELVPIPQHSAGHQPQGPHRGQMFASALLPAARLALRSTKGCDCPCLRALSQIDGLLLLHRHLTGAEMFIFKVGDAAPVTVFYYNDFDAEPAICAPRQASP